MAGSPLRLHHIDESLRHRILTLLRENYVGFGPTLAAEKLQERHGIDKRLYFTQSSRTKLCTRANIKM